MGVDVPSVLRAKRELSALSADGTSDFSHFYRSPDFT
jgi:hypothetical protein